MAAPRSKMSGPDLNRQPRGMQRSFRPFSCCGAEDAISRPLRQDTTGAQYLHRQTNPNESSAYPQMRQMRPPFNPSDEIPRSAASSLHRGAAGGAGGAGTTNTIPPYKTPVTSSHRPESDPMNPRPPAFTNGQRANADRWGPNLPAPIHTNRNIGTEEAVPQYRDVHNLQAGPQTRFLPHMQPSERDVHRSAQTQGLSAMRQGDTVYVNDQQANAAVPMAHRGPLPNQSIGQVPTPLVNSSGQQGRPGARNTAVDRAQPADNEHQSGLHPVNGPQTARTGHTLQMGAPDNKEHMPQPPLTASTVGAIPRAQDRMPAKTGVLGPHNLPPPSRNPVSTPSNTRDGIIHRPAHGQENPRSPTIQMPPRSPTATVPAIPDSHQASHKSRQTANFTAQRFNGHTRRATPVADQSEPGTVTRDATAVSGVSATEAGRQRSDLQDREDPAHRDLISHERTKQPMLGRVPDGSGYTHPNEVNGSKFGFSKPPANDEQYANDSSRTTLSGAPRYPLSQNRGSASLSIGGQNGATDKDSGLDDAKVRQQQSISAWDRTQNGPDGKDGAAYVTDGVRGTGNGTREKSHLPLRDENRRGNGDEKIQGGLTSGNTASGIDTGDNGKRASTTSNAPTFIAKKRLSLTGTAPGKT